MSRIISLYFVIFIFTKRSSLILIRGKLCCSFCRRKILLIYCIHFDRLMECKPFFSTFRKYGCPFAQLLVTNRLQLFPLLSVCLKIAQDLGKVSNVNKLHKHKFVHSLSVSIIFPSIVKRSPPESSASTVFVSVMSAACLLHLGRCSVLSKKVVGLFQQRSNLQLTGFWRSLYTPSEKRHSNTRFDADSSGRPTTWDSFGIWDNRIDEPILLPPSIRYGKPIPKVSLSNVGCASLIGQRKENEDRFQVSQMTDNIMYFAVFDGHGGSEAADFCEKYMEKFIK